MSLLGTQTRPSPHCPLGPLISWWIVGSPSPGRFGLGRVSGVGAEQASGACGELAHAEALCPSAESLDTHRAPGRALNKTQQALEHLRLRLGPPGSLQGKLRLLEQESEQQELQIQSFESDLAEIRADKQNLEAILKSLPQSCASWQ